MNMIMRVLAYCFAIFAFSAHNALAQTDRANCEAGDIPVIIYYPSGQSTLPNSAREVIGNVVDTIKLCSVERVIVEGHADRTGLKSTNLILSKKPRSPGRSRIAAKRSERGILYTLRKRRAGTGHTNTGQCLRTVKPAHRNTHSIKIVREKQLHC